MEAKMKILVTDSLAPEGLAVFHNARPSGARESVTSIFIFASML